MKNFGIYAIITKPSILYEEVAEVFAEEEIKFVQLREKHLSDAELLNVARKLKSMFHHTSTKLIVNDRVDIALLSGADGLHIGQEDLPIYEVRKILPENFMIGVSTHNLIQLNIALQNNPSYVGFGPIFPTVTKANPDPVVGTTWLKEALNIATVPVVAIGGIFPENIDEVLLAGAKNICMVRYFMEAKSKEELKKRIQFVKRKLNEYDTNAVCH
ncbi:MAG: thiamine phosphate synthase [Bacteroidales bacterium]|nr:thiamine phosphate synthase [Bacteroidales bacterium]